LNTTRRSLKDAVFEATPADIIPYNPADPTQGQAGQCLFSLLHSFDAYLPPDAAFAGPLARLVQARADLLEHLDLLLGFPLVLFGGYPAVRQTLNNYLQAYADLLGLFHQHEAVLHQRDTRATDFVAAELIRLDTIYIQTMDEVDESEWKAMLTPLHAFIFGASVKFSTPFMLMDAC